MAENTPTVMIAVFDDFEHAENALNELNHAGFGHDQVGVITPRGKVQHVVTLSERTEETAGEGAVAGAVTGGAVGTLAGALVVGLIPGIGPALAGGLLMGVVLGGLAGAAAGSYLGPFLALGFSHEEAVHFERELKAGRTLVTVKAPGREAEALTILRSHGAYGGNLACFADVSAPTYAHLQS